MTRQHKPKQPTAAMTSSKSADPSEEHEHSAPEGPTEIIGKAAREAGYEDGVWNKVKAVGRELDRNVGGEYERREDKPDTE